MLYHYNNVKHFSLFLLDLYFEIFSVFDHLNFKSFGIFFLHNKDFFELKFDIV